MEKASKEELNSKKTSIFVTAREEEAGPRVPNVKSRLHTKGLSDLKMSE